MFKMKAMNKQDAEKADLLLRYLTDNHNQAISPAYFEVISKKLSIDINDIDIFISIFLSDKLIKHIKHPTAPDVAFEAYYITSEGKKFIHFDGGYSKQRRYNRYKDQNVKFTWIRHWVWFFAFILSFLLNLYFLIS